MSEMEAWAEFYASNGLVFFPLYGIMNARCRCHEGAKCSNPGKHPQFKWKDKPSKVPNDTDNMGVSTDNLVVVDLDGDVPVSVLHEYPETFTTSTGRGFHLWYRADPSKPIKSFVGWKHKVDIRAVGGLVAAPPSRHISGAEYRAVNDCPIMPISSALLSILPERTNNFHRIGTPVRVELDETPEFMFPVVASLVTDMLKWKDGRNVTLFRVACRYFEFAANKLVGTDALDHLFQAAVETGLERDEIERTLESARRSV